MEYTLTRLDKEYAIANKISFEDMREIIKEEIAMGWELVQNYDRVMDNQHSTAIRNIEENL